VGHRAHNRRPVILRSNSLKLGWIRITIAQVMYSSDDLITVDTCSLYITWTYKRIHIPETTALSRSWKKTATAFGVSVSKTYYFVSVVLQLNWRLWVLFFEVPRSHTVSHENSSNGRQDFKCWKTKRVRTNFKIRLQIYQRATKIQDLLQTEELIVTSCLSGRYSFKIIVFWKTPS
jgi:hypothetical protein